MSTRRWIRPVLALALGLALPMLGAPAALAAPPSNDAFGNATVIADLPFHDAIDTSEATRAGSDPDCTGANDGHTVWYSFTSSTDVEISANTFGSSYDTTLSAYTGTRTSLTLVACSDDEAGTAQSAILFTASGGETYHLMVAAFDGNLGGAMELSVVVAPPPIELKVTIAPDGSVNADGLVRIHGTVTCSRPADPVELSGSVRQERSHGATLAYFEGSVSCSGRTPWRAKVFGETGVYHSGKVRATIMASFTDVLRGDTTNVSAARDVTLHLR
jgi:uncharacterized protein DUF6299